MAVTILLVVLIVGFLAITIFAVTAMIIVRRREQTREKSDEIAKTIEDLDKTLDSALSELNKMGELIRTDIDEKYKAILFLYELIESKQKEIEEQADAETVAHLTEKAKLRLIDFTIADEPKPENTSSPEGSSNTAIPETPPASAEKKRPVFINPKHKQIWEMRETGQNISDIAKELGMGQGEVKLILDLADRAS